MKILTLCFLLDKNRVLLGQKKRGFGVGKWNGFGGKLEVGETIETAMKREVLEEVGVTVLDFEKIGVVWESNPTWPDQLEIHVFVSSSFSGTPCESDEMRPKWFEDLPYEEMWEADRLWVPSALRREKVSYVILLDEKNNVRTADRL